MQLFEQGTSDCVKYRWLLRHLLGLLSLRSFSWKTEKKLDLDGYFTNPQKGQHAEGGGAHALGGERSQPAHEGWWWAGLCYSSRKVVPLRDGAKHSTLQEGGCLEASLWSSKIVLVQWQAGWSGARTMPISDGDTAMQPFNNLKNRVRRWSWHLSTIVLPSGGLSGA